MTHESSGSAPASSFEPFATSVTPGPGARTPSSGASWLSVRLSARWPLLLAIAVWVMPIGSVWGAGTTEVSVTVKDEEGKTVPGVEIVLTALDTKEKSLGTAPWTMKTNKKGTAFFPFLAWNSQGEGRYGISIKKEGFFIRHFKIESRQLQAQEQ